MSAAPIHKVSVQGLNEPHNTKEQETQKEWITEPAKFESPLPEHEFKLHVLNRRRVSASIENFVKTLRPNLDAAEVRKAIQQNSASILQKAGFDPEIYGLPKDVSRSNYLLASIGKTDDAPYSMQISVSADAQKTDKGSSVAANSYSAKTKQGLTLTIRFHHHDGVFDPRQLGAYGEDYSAVTPTSTWLSNVPTLPADPLIGITAAFNLDPRPNKIYLGVGAYYDEDGVRPEMSSIGLAKLELETARHAETKHTATAYLPIEGLPEFNSSVKKLVFGDDPVFHERVATVQGLGGTNPITTGACFLKKFLPPGTKTYISEPSWPAHRMVFENAGFEVETYPYYNRENYRVDFNNLLKNLQSLAEKSVVVLQACCHNPTGADLTDAQWQQVIATVKKNKLIPFIDMAYQGFGEGVLEDGKVVRDFSKAVPIVFVSTSYSKNFAQYGDRVGALSVVTGSSIQASLVKGQLKAIIRANYSNPPAYGAVLVSSVLRSPTLYKKWVEEDIGPARDRIQEMRNLFVDKLKERAPEHDFEYVRNQRGMFSLLNLSVGQIRSMRFNDAVYLIENGRICIAGLNKKNMESVVNSIVKVLKKPVLAEGVNVNPSGKVFGVESKNSVFKQLKQSV